MAPTLTIAALALYIIILVASLSTPLLGALEPKSRASRYMQFMLWIGLAFVVLELAGLTAVAVARVTRTDLITGAVPLRIVLLTFVFTAHAIWLFFGLGTLRVPESAVKGPGTLLLGLSCVFATICFASTILLVLRAGFSAAGAASAAALILGALGLFPLVLFVVLVFRERKRPPETIH